MLGRYRPGFLLEAPQAVGVGGEKLGQNLDRDLAIQPGVVRAVNFAHSARIQRRAYFILSENRSGSQGHVSGEDYTFTRGGRPAKNGPFACGGSK